MLFRGYRVGSVETGTFDTQKRNISYQLFINAPYDLNRRPAMFALEIVALRLI